VGAINTIGRVLLLRPPFPDGSGQVLEHIDRGVPVNARVGDGDTSLQSRRTFGGYFLVALVKVGLDHDTDDAVLALTKLVRNDLGDLRLISVVLEGVA